MSKKPKRGSPAIDMTAMVDVAFLLLTFFILTTTNFREESPAEVDIPSSVAEKPIPEKGLMTIHVTDTGTVFVGFSDIPTREQALKIALENKQLTDNPAAIPEEWLNRFSSVENFGVPFRAFTAWLDMTGQEVQNFKQPGIPFKIDSVTNAKNELYDWIQIGLKAHVLATGEQKKIRVAIKGDGSAKFPDVKQVISTVQDFNINTMSLITEMEDPPNIGGGL
ncbi:MAG: biopolymer transporter ExbD [Bacteroidota bacterium]